MEVVINKCYGGFCLSPLGLVEYYKRKGRNVYFYRQTKYSLRDNHNEFVKVNINNVSCTDHPFLKDLGNKINEWPDEDGIYEGWSPKNRSDPDLVAVVRNLGKKANGDCANLKIVEIPNGINYFIDEYDGLEHIAECHRTWE